MKNRLIEIEQQRLAALGFSSVVTTVAIPVRTALQNIAIGNDTYILSGIRMSDADVAADTHNVCISSATDAIEGTQRQLSEMQDAMLRTMRSYIVVKTDNINESEWTPSASIPVFTLDFIKITPLSK